MIQTAFVIIVFLIKGPLFDPFADKAKDHPAADSSAKNDGVKPGVTFVEPIESLHNSKIDTHKLK